MIASILWGDEAEETQYWAATLILAFMADTQPPYKLRAPNLDGCPSHSTSQ